MDGHRMSRRRRTAALGTMASLSIVLGAGLPAGAENSGDGGNGSDASAGLADGHGRSDAPGLGEQGKGGGDDHGRAGTIPGGSASPANSGGPRGPKDAPGSTGGGGSPAPEGPTATAPAASGGTSSSANNGCGDYCSAPGAPSGNGNGGGQASGRPAAGTVGEADDKNPRGQFRNGGDHNNGYECDGNHGIARGNPAHTRNCPPAEPPVDPPVVPPVNPLRPPVPPGPLNSVVTVPPTPGPGPLVVGRLLEMPLLTATGPTTAVPRVEVLGVTIERTGALAVTGANTVDIGALGLSLIFGGTALVALDRRRRPNR